MMNMMPPQGPPMPMGPQPASAPQSTPAGAGILSEAGRGLAPVGMSAPSATVTSDQVMALLRNDPLRRFRIDIETDSTVAVDEQEQKQSAVEFVQGMGAFIKAAVPLAMQLPELEPLVKELMLFLVRAFRAGRTTEEAFEEAGAAMDKAAQAAIASRGQPQQGDPRAQAAAAKDMALAEKAKAEAQALPAKHQAQAQAVMMKAQSDAQAQQADTQIKVQQAQAGAAKTQAEIGAIQADQQRQSAQAASDAQRQDAQQAHRQHMDVAGMMQDAAQSFTDTQLELERMRQAHAAAQRKPTP